MELTTAQKNTLRFINSRNVVTVYLEDDYTRVLVHRLGDVVKHWRISDVEYSTIRKFIEPNEKGRFILTEQGKELV